ncbi:MAG TPA: response regulator [Allocoleopsis sp.]
MAKRILVIDDEEDMREIAQASLEIMAGLEVIAACSFSEGLSKAETEQPDAILLDVMLPDRDGIALLQKLQENPTTQKIPVIFLTANTLLFNRQQFLAMGAKGAIAKPFKPTKLADQTLKILGWCPQVTGSELE